MELIYIYFFKILPPFSYSSVVGNIDEIVDLGGSGVKEGFDVSTTPGTPILPLLIGCSLPSNFLALTSCGRVSCPPITPTVYKIRKGKV